MKDRKKKGILRRRLVCSLTALAMAFTMMAVPQGLITAHAEDEDSSDDWIRAVVDTSPYARTQIVNGDFEVVPWENYVYNGVTYTSPGSSVSNKITASFPNGVGEGWNTTENTPYKGNLFEVWPSAAPLDTSESTTRFTGNGTYFIEMNTTNPACLYQDLPTQGGDVIKWTLQHAARDSGGGCDEQKMYVTIGAPERNDGQIVAASGVNAEINTHIKAEGKAEYRCTGVTTGADTVAFANSEELAGLAVKRTSANNGVDEGWKTAAGIYIVPEGQDVTRFAFCAEAQSSGKLSCGNFLDNITFSTLIGNVKATKVPGASEEDKKIVVTGYWGDKGTAENYLIVKVGDATNKIDMSGVENKNFKVAVPDTTTETNSDVVVYHSNYISAAKEVAVSHEHSWVYEEGTGSDTNKLYAYCNYDTDSTSCLAYGVENKKPLTLSAENAEYTGKPYTGASIDNNEKTEWVKVGLDIPRIYYEGTDTTQYVKSENAPINAGTYKATISAGEKTAEAEFTIQPKPVTGAGMSVTINKSSYEYDGTAKTPSVTVKDGSTKLTLNTNYTISGETSGTEVKNDYKITITGNGNYTGTKDIKWKINKATFKNVTKNEYSGIYDGEPHSASVTVNAPTGATVTYSKDGGSSYQAESPVYTAAGIYTVCYKLEKENYVTSTGALTVDIQRKPITAEGITVDIDSDSYVYNGAFRTPVITVNDGEKTLIKDTDYTLSGDTTGKEVSGDNDYKITVEGIGNYTGTVDKTWKIVQDSQGTGGGSSGGGTGGSGGGSVQDTPAAPDSPGESVEKYDIPVKNENTVKVDAEIQDGIADVSEITGDTVDKIVNNKDSESKVDTITIDLSGAKQKVTGVILSKQSVMTLEEATGRKDNGIDTVTVELSGAMVVMDNQTLKALLEQAAGPQIELVVANTEQNKLKAAQKAALSQHQVAMTFEAYFVSDGQRIHDFKGGNTAVYIDFTPEPGKNTGYYHLVYVAEDGDLTRYKTKYQNSRLIFTTTHFSDYAVIYDTSEKNETEEEETGEGSGTDDYVGMDTSYSRLRLRVPNGTSTTNVLKWTKESGADGYVIYGAPCNSKKQKYKFKELAAIKSGNTTTWTHKKLSPGTYYKYYIKAYKLENGKKVWLAKSKTVHATTTGGKFGNAKSVKVNKTAVSLEINKTFVIKAEQVVKDKPIARHHSIKYESSNSRIASVTGNGTIKAKKKGSCYIYVYAQNGMYKRVKVTVQ